MELNEVWDRYCDISKENNVEIPHSFVSRMSTFKEKLVPLIRKFYEIIVLHDRPANGRRTVFVPIEFSRKQWSNRKNEDDDTVLCTIPEFRPQDEDFSSMVHLALKLRSDIREKTSLTTININDQAAIDCVPESLYMFLNLMLGGEKLLEENEGEYSENDSLRQCRIRSIAQDIVFSVSGGNCLTPKHIGLASSLHQATRSKDLVHMCYRAGHITSYHDILKLDTALAENTLQTMSTDGSALPPNLMKDRFVHFSADNIDINDRTLDGKNTFHATQVAAWQRGLRSKDILNCIKLSTREMYQTP